MAPFPESEDMTIKRLMVALRKNDHQLLKMGTYKLHENFIQVMILNLLMTLDKFLILWNKNNIRLKFQTYFVRP